MKSRSVLTSIALAAVLVVGVSGTASAQKVITQAKAIAGGITPGDAAGFPVTLSQRGSYKLTSNLTVPNSDTTAIKVTADFVTIDLNGFSILGPNVCSLTSGCSALGSGWGIDATGKTNLTVMNGTISGVGFIGVWADPGSRVERMTIQHCGDSGVVMARSTIVNSTIRLNGIYGIDGSGVIQGNVISANGRAWFFKVGIDNTTTGSATIIGNSLTDNLMNLTADTGYSQNVLAGSPATIVGGVNMGHNVCGTALCP